MPSIRAAREWSAPTLPEFYKARDAVIADGWPAKIAAELVGPSPRAGRMQLAERRLNQLAEQLIAGLMLGGRPTITEDRGGLQQITNHCDVLLRLLDRESFQHVYALDAQAHELWPACKARPALRTMPVAEVAAQINQLRTWAENAMFVGGQSGRPSRPVEDDAVDSLATLYKSFTGREPKRRVRGSYDEGEFKDFACPALNELLLTVRAALDIKVPDITAATIRRVLDRRKLG